MKRPKQLISVPVGTEPSLRKYNHGGEDYIYYGYGPCRLYPTGSIKDLIVTLTAWKEKYRDRYQDMRFEENRDCGCYHDCSCSPSYVLYGKRYETDLEYNWRIAKEEKANAQREQRERDEYERLAKKFAEQETKENPTA
jgi:hypothetical protein